MVWLECVGKGRVMGEGEKGRGEGLNVPSRGFEFYPEQIKKPLPVLDREMI